jgi:pimeloyl-ACP methyl ester carboxylesterase
MGIPIYPPGSIEGLQTKLDSGDRAGVVTTLLSEIARMPESSLKMLQLSPSWPARVAAAHTIPRELRASESYRFDTVRFAAMRTPTLLVLGGESPAFFKAAIDTVHAAITTSKIVVLAGQRHTAINTAPDLFVREVTWFLE